MKAAAPAAGPGLTQEIGPALEASGIVGVWHTNETTRTALMDAGAADLLAGDVALAGRPVSTMTLLAAIHPEDREMVLARVLHCSQHCESFTVEHRVVRPGGEIRWLQGRGRFFRETDGSVRGRGIIMDVTESRHPGAVVALAGHGADRRDPLDVAAAHTIAARDAILRTESGPLRTAVDGLLHALGRAIARAQSRYTDDR